MAARRTDERAPSLRPHDAPDYYSAYAGDLKDNELRILRCEWRGLAAIASSLNARPAVKPAGAEWLSHRL